MESEMIDPVLPIDARALHAEIGVGRDFATWIQDRIKKFQLVKGKDYEVFPEMGGNPKGGRPAKAYHLTVIVARWLASDIGTERGRKVIKYLVARDEQLSAIQQQPAPVLTMEELCKAYLELKEENLRAQAVIGEARVLLTDVKEELETVQQQVEVKEAELSEAEQKASSSLTMESLCRAFHLPQGGYFLVSSGVGRDYVFGGLRSLDEDVSYSSNKIFRVRCGLLRKLRVTR